MLSESILHQLVGNPLRTQVLRHPFLSRMATADLGRTRVGVVLGQWWHPLHYFPTFLARAVAVVPLAEKTAISKILFQELGEGDPSAAHEAIYLETMGEVGFALETVTAAPPLEATRRLVAAYADSAETCAGALGFVYATEVADLAMVSAIGAAVRRATRAERLRWVDIHVSQEPEHVAKARDAVGLDLSARDTGLLVENAQLGWALWREFLTSLDAAVS
jgi:pyrroloquinoline quinone (PQQ) biosynthesis protein C